MDESCSCDLNSIDNTESDGSPAIVVSRNQVNIDVQQSSEVASLPEATTAMSHTETPTILEEVNSEVSVSCELQTTQETSEIVSIESSSEFLSDTQKVESSSPESCVNGSEQKSDETTGINEEEQNNEDSLSTIRESEESSQSPSTETAPEEDLIKKDSNNLEEKSANNSETSADGSPAKEIANGYCDKSDASETDVVSNKEPLDLPEKIIDKIEETKIPTETDTQVVITNESDELIKDAGETEEEKSSTIISVEDKVSNKIIESEKDNVPVENEVVENSLDENITIEVEENKSDEIEQCPAETVDESEKNQVSEENEKSTSRSSSPVEKEKTIIEKTDALNTENNASNAISNGECNIEKIEQSNSESTDKEAEDAVDSNTKEPSIISTSHSDKQEEEVLAAPVTVTSADSIVDQTPSDVSKHRDDVESCVDNATQVPNAKEQIPTISTVCDAAAQNGIDGVVPENVNAEPVVMDDTLIAAAEFDRTIVTEAHRRRSSLPNVSTENLAADDNESDASLSPTKNSSPQKRPRSASTSTQVEQNHFGENI